MNAGLIFALLTTVFWSIGIFPFTQAARRMGSNTLNHFRLLLAAIIIGVIAFCMGMNSFIQIFSSNYSNAWLWLGLSGIIGLTIGDYFAFAMYSILGARIGSVLTTFAPAAALVLGSLLIDEHISFIGIIGIIITIAGVNFVSFGKSEKEKMPDHGHGSIAYGIVTGILAALCQGAGLVFAKKGMLSQPISFHLDPMHATFMRLSAATASLFLFSLIKGNIKEVLAPVFSNKNNGIKYAISGTLFGPVTGMCFSIYTVSLLDPSVAQTIFSLVPAFAFILSSVIFRERITLRSVAGLTIAILGVLILIWRERLKGLF